NLRDAELAVGFLEESGYRCDWKRIESRSELELELGPQGCGGESYDLVLVDSNLPSLDGKAAITLIRQWRLALPCVFFSGTIGEEEAIETLKAGATDYVLKQRISRLVPAVERALHERGLDRQRRQAEQALHASETRFRALIENSNVAVALVDAQGLLR